MNKNHNIVVKKGLMIGINYTGTESQLGGCINDQENLKDFLKKNNYIKNSEIVLMNDNFEDEYKPTKANIIKQIDALVNFANANDDKDVELLFTYSGHGSYLRDNNNDERDGKDEVLCPIDYTTNGFITDDFLKKRLVENVKLVILMDCCHSGTIIDLKYNYLVNWLNTCVTHMSLQNRANVIMISGCKDSQKSADAFIKDKQKGNYEYQGAMTASFIHCFKDGMSYRTLIEKMRKWLRNGGYSQVPQLSSSKQINIDREFLLSCYD